MKKYLETNENRNITFQNLGDATKAGLRRKCIMIQAHLEKQENSKMNNMTLHLKKLEKEQIKFKVEGRE